MKLVDGGADTGACKDKKGLAGTIILAGGSVGLTIGVLDRMEM